MSEQLRQNPCEKYNALDRQRKRGSINVLFKVELALFSYIFVGKGALSGHPFDDSWDEEETQG